MDRLTYLKQRHAECHAEIRKLDESAVDDAGERRNLTPDEDKRFDELVWERDACAAEYEQIEKRRKIAEQAFADEEKREAGEDRGAPAVHLSVDPFDAQTRAKIGDREAVKRAIDATSISMTDEAKAEVEAKLNRSGVPEMKGFPRHVLAFGSDAYARAFAKVSLDEKETLTREEVAALEFARSEARALGLTDGSGGYLIPTFLDPTVINTSDGSINPFRQISRVVQVSGDNWNGVTSAGISIAWGTEFSVPADGAPAFGAPSITPYKAHGFVPISIEGYEDIASIGPIVASMFQQAKDDDEAQKFATGSGSNQPTGIVTALAGTLSQTNMATNGAIAAADLFKAQQHLGPRYQQRASWVMNLAYVNKIRALGSSDNYFAQTVRLPESADFPLLGRPAYQASGMTDACNTTTNNAIVFGDFNDYVIVDRIGMQVEFIPHLFDQATARPNGSRGWYTHWRTGADSVNDTAFTLLFNPNTAFV